MKVEFDWKKFKDVKPEIKAKIIFKTGNDKMKEFVVIGEYMGFKEDGHNFEGGKLMLKSLAKQNKKTLKFPEGVDNLEWDYYNENWL